MSTFPKNARVIFTGCSITAHCNYTLRILNHYRKKLPDLNVKFFAACQAGGSLVNAITHFDDMILPFEPTHATVMYGGNDCTLGVLNRPDGEDKTNKLSEAAENYKRNLDTFIEMLLKHNINPTFVTQTCYGEFMSIDTPIYKGGHARTAEFAEYMRKACIKYGIDYADIHARMSELYTHEELLIGDRVHPTDFGHYRMAEEFLRHQGLDIGEYVPHGELLSDSWNAEWFKNAYRFSRIWGAYVNLPWLKLYEKPYEEQMDIINEYVLTRGYSNDPAARDFSTEFSIFKPIQHTFVENLRRLNGDNI